MGRADVLARLHALVDGVLAGRGGGVLLAGEAGIGKTTVLGAAARHAEAGGARVARAWGWAGEGAPGFWLWRQVLRELDLDVADPDESTVDGPAARFALFDAITAALLAESRIQPVVLVLDDLQWADEPSLRLLDFAARRMPAGALGVLGGYRDTAGHEHLAALAALMPVLRLGGLGVDAVAELVAQAGGGDLDATVAADLHRRTGGNPFFVQQVAWLMPHGPAGVPPGVAEALAQRLADLPASTVNALRVAAAIGARVPPDVLAAALGGADSVDAVLAPAVAARILLVDGGVRFAHDLWREYAYELVAVADRPALHRRVAEALERSYSDGGETGPAEIAEHHVRADPTSAAAYRWSVTAAEEAGRALAYEQAVTHWDQALPAAGEHRLATLLGLAGAARRAGDAARAVRTYRRAAELARQEGSADGLGEAALGLHAVGRRTFTDIADLVELHDEALSTMEPSALRLRVMASLSRVLAWYGADTPRARGLAEAAVAAARSGADTATLAECLLARHFAFAGPGSAGERLEVAAELIAVAAAADDLELAAQARLLAASDRLELGDPGFRAELDGFLRLAESAPDPRLRYACLVRRTMLALLGGRLDEAERLVETANVLGVQLGEAGAADVHFEHSWDLAAERGQLGQALGLVQQEFSDPESVAGRGLRCLVLLAAGDTAGARELAAPLLESPPATTVPGGQWLLDLAYAVELVVGLDARQPAQWLYDSLLPHAGLVVVSGVAVAVRGSVAHLLGMLAVTLGRPEEARGHYRHAAAVHEALGAVVWTLRSRCELATLDGDPVALNEIAVSARRLGALGVAAAAEGMAARAGAGAEAVFRREGAQWTLAYAGTTVRLPHAKGLADLAVLLAARGQPVSAVDLVAAESGAQARADLGMGADELLDETARRAYRQRLGELAEVVEQAQEWGDLARADRARDEREALLAELAAAAGLSGRHRRLGDQSERARKAVTARIRDTLRRVSAVHPVLGAHLSASVSTGTWCVYSPAHPVVWRT